LEGKPFIFPLCDKGNASRNGLKHHYKTHQNGNENKTHLYYCHECKEGFKTKRKFWLHDVKLHGLIETSSEESDSEMVAGHEERIESTRINMTDTRTDVRSGGDIRGDRMDWSLGRVSKFKPGNDRKVKNVEVQYKNPKSGEPINKYGGQDYVTVEPISGNSACGSNQIK
jgi:hypothetical protein